MTYNHNEKRLPDAIDIPRERLNFLKEKIRDLLKASTKSDRKSVHIENFEKLFNDNNLSNKEIAYVLEIIIEFLHHKNTKMLTDIVMSSIADDLIEGENDREKNENDENDLMYR